MRMMRIVGALLLCSVALPVLAQDKPADTMQVLREKIRADKKLLVAANMDLTDEVAKRLVGDYLAIEQDRIHLKQSYLPKLREVLPEKKVARYFQIENKIEAAVRYDLAEKIPLVK